MVAPFLKRHRCAKVEKRSYPRNRGRPNSRVIVRQIDLPPQSAPSHRQFLHTRRHYPLRCRGGRTVEDDSGRSGSPSAADLRQRHRKQSIAAVAATRFFTMIPPRDGWSHRRAGSCPSAANWKRTMLRAAQSLPVGPSLYRATPRPDLQDWCDRRKSRVPHRQCRTRRYVPFVEGRCGSHL